MPSTKLEVRALDPEADEQWRATLLAEDWGGPLQARRGELVDVRLFPALIAERGAERVGLLVYRDCSDGWWELVLISAVESGTGAGSALLAGLVERVGPGGRMWVVTTNDNVDALRFYQRRGFRLRSVRPGAVDEARRSHKPDIPTSGRYGIPLRDELELELLL